MYSQTVSTPGSTADALRNALSAAIGTGLIFQVGGSGVLSIVGQHASEKEQQAALDVQAMLEQALRRKQDKIAQIKADAKRQFDAMQQKIADIKSSSAHDIWMEKMRVSRWLSGKRSAMVAACCSAIEATRLELEKIYQKFDANHAEREKHSKQKEAELAQARSELVKKFESEKAKLEQDLQAKINAFVTESEERIKQLWEKK